MMTLLRKMNIVREKCSSTKYKQDIDKMSTYVFFLKKKGR